MKRFLSLLVLAGMVIALGVWAWQKTAAPKAETIVSSSLQSLQAQNRLNVFAARFVTVVTSRKAQFGLAAQKTMIVPAMVRYEVDLAKLTPANLSWDEAAKRLSVTLPPLAVAGPEFDLKAVQEYQSGAILMALTDAEALLDAENRAKAERDVLAQAKAGPLMAMAREAAIRAVERSFAMPLAAAGVEAQVKVEFAQ